jgi:hypothetical protein
MHGHLCYSTFQSHSLPVVQKSTQPPTTICAQQISHQLARWLLRNLSIILEHGWDVYRSDQRVTLFETLEISYRFNLLVDFRRCNG